MAEQQPLTYRVNTGETTFKPFEAASVEEACAYVRDNQHPNYAFPKWLQVVRNGGWVWVQ
jgi:hypothetical protein